MYALTFATRHVHAVQALDHAMLAQSDVLPRLLDLANDSQVGRTMAACPADAHCQTSQDYMSITAH